MKSPVLTVGLAVLASVLVAQAPETGNRPVEGSGKERPANVATQPTPVPLLGMPPAEFRRVTLETPARLSLVPWDNKPLQRGEPMRFRLLLEGAPMPINMFSGRVDYTSGTIGSLRLVDVEPGYQVTISDPNDAGQGRISQWFAGIALEGVRAGELATFEALVPPTAPDTVSLVLSDHPYLEERLAFDDTRVTLDYQRTLESDRVTSMTVVAADPETPAERFKTAQERRSIMIPRRKGPPPIVQDQFNMVPLTGNIASTGS